MSRRLDHEGAREEFNRFVAGTVAPLLRAVYLVVWDEQEAEDLLQECYMRLARRWPRVRRMENPRAYARKVLINLALDGRGRRRRRRDELILGGRIDLEGRQDSVTAAVFARVEAGTDLQRALGALPPRQRAALVLRFFEDLSEAQTADIMGCSVGTVKSTTARAIDRLRTLAEDQDPETGPDGRPHADPTDIAHLECSHHDMARANASPCDQERNPSR